LLIKRVNTSTHKTTRNTPQEAASKRPRECTERSGTSESANTHALGERWTSGGGSERINEKNGREGGRTVVEVMEEAQHMWFSVTYRRPLVAPHRQK
jgi:hypothetical protein